MTTMQMQIPIVPKNKPSKFKEAQELTDTLIDTLANDLNGIDEVIKSKAVSNVASNLSNLIHFFSMGDEIKTHLQNSRIKISSLHHSIEEMDGHLTLLAEYIRTDHKKYSLEKIEKIFKIKDKIGINLDSLHDINKKCSNYCYSLWGYSIGNGGNDNSNNNYQHTVNDSDLSFNNNSPLLSLFKKESDNNNNNDNEKNRKNKSFNNSKSPLCLHLKELGKQSNNKSIHNRTHNVSPTLFIFDSNRSYNKHTHKLNTHSNNKQRLASNEINKCNSNISNTNTNTNPKPASAYNQLSFNKKRNNDSNKAQKLYTLSHSALSCNSNSNKDRKCEIPFNDDNISFNQNKIKELIKEIEKINESLIEEKSINNALKSELNKCKEHHLVNSNYHNNEINNTSSSTDILTYLKDISEMIYNILTMENQLRKSLMSLSISSLSSFDLMEFTKGHNIIKDNLISLSTQIESIKDNIEKQKSLSTNNNPSSPSLSQYQSQSQYQQELNNIKAVYNQSLTNKETEIKDLQSIIQFLKKKLESSPLSSRSINPREEPENQATIISVTLNREIRQLKDTLLLKEKELSESKELYQSDIQNKNLIESLLKSELQSIQKTYEISLNELKETIAKKDNEIFEHKQKQSLNEISIINQLKLNHQKSIAQLKELYTQSINNKNEVIDSLTKQCNTLKSTRQHQQQQQQQQQQSLLSLRENKPSINREEIIKPFKDEISKLQSQLQSKDSVINNYELNIDSICKKTIDKKLKEYEMKQLIQKQNDYEVEVLNDKLKLISEENELLNTQVTELHNQVIELEVKEKEFMKQIDSKDSEVLELTAIISRMEKKVEIKENTIEELQSNIFKDKKESETTIDQMNNNLSKYEFKIDEMKKKKLFKQISHSVLQLSILPIERKAIKKRMETYAFSIHAKAKQPIAITEAQPQVIKPKVKYAINTNRFSLIVKEGMRMFELKKLDVSKANSNISILPILKLKKAYSIANIGDSSFSVNSHNNKKSGELKKVNTCFSLINNVNKVFDQKALKKFSNFVLIKPTIKIRELTIATHAFSYYPRRQYGFISKKLINENTMLSIDSNMRKTFDTSKTHIAVNEVCIDIKGKTKEMAVNIIDNINSITINDIPLRRVDVRENENRLRFGNLQISNKDDDDDDDDERQLQIIQMQLNKHINAFDSFTINEEQQFTLFYNEDKLKKEMSKTQFDTHAIEICSNINELNVTEDKNNKELQKQKEPFSQYDTYKPISLNTFSIINAKNISTQAHKDKQCLDIANVQEICFEPNIKQISLNISPMPDNAIEIISYKAKSNIILSSINEMSFEIHSLPLPVKPSKKIIDLSISQLNISLESAKRNILLSIAKIKENSFNIISSVTKFKTQFKPESVISLQLIRTKHISINKSQTQSPYSSKYDNEEEEDEASEYTEDNEELEKLKEDHTKLQAENKTLKEENEVLNSKLDEVDDLIAQEKDELVGHLRLAFEKLIIEIQITTKAKECITAILRMLSYSDDNIFEIYNQLGKKKGLFGFFK